VASDAFGYRVKKYFINHYVPEKPSGARDFIWA